MRRAMIAVHLWLGLILGGLWALQGLTGSVLVFHREIERLAGPVVGVGPPASLDRIAALQPQQLVPGRGAALTTPEQVAAGIAGTRNFIADVRASVEEGVKAGKDLNAVYKDTMARLTPTYGHWVIFQHCMPFDVTRCYDEMTQYADPRVWTAERDVQMWKALQA